MKILMTGATASQVSSKRSSETFAGLVHKALSDDRHDVTWIDPSVSLSKDYLAEFDSIVVGIAPPTSTAAHRIYGALSVIQYAHELGTLRLMLDAPEPKRVWAGIRAIYNKPEELTKDFYAKRREYRKVSDEETLGRLHNAISTLYTEEWPKTIYPAFPWMSFPSISSEIPMTDPSNLVGLNFDEKIIYSDKQITSQSHSEYWVADSINTKWTRGIEKTIQYSVIPTKASRWEESDAVFSRMESAVGCLVSVYGKNAPWWSISLAQALHTGIPVVTDWTLSSMLGAEWSVLAHAVEDMSDRERFALSDRQKTSYLGSIPSWKTSVELTCTALLRK